MAFELLSSAISEITITSYIKHSFVCCIRRKSNKPRLGRQYIFVWPIAIQCKLDGFQYSFLNLSYELGDYDFFIYNTEFRMLRG